MLAWGGTNTLAQALLQARQTKSGAELEPLIAKLRVYSISDQDDAGPWIRREFPRLHYIVMPSTPDGDQWTIGLGTASVTGSRAALLGWLARGLTDGVDGDPLPRLPKGR